MTDDRDPATDRWAPEPDERLRALLGRPDLWYDPPDDTLDGILDDIAVESASGATERGNGQASGGWQRWLGPVAAGVAAAVFVLAVVRAIDDEPGGPSEGVAVALAGTERAPAAEAVATVIDTSLGTRIDLAIAGLPPAPAGSYYEAWMRPAEDSDRGVSAGSFHMRGGDGEIELWSGVRLDDYPVLTVSLEDEGDGPGSSGRTVLVGP